MVLRTQNETYGFYGTIAYAHVDQDEAWVIAFQTISHATGLEDGEAVRAFLDSRIGRHFADSVHNHLHRRASLQDAVDAAVAEWMSRRIGRHAYHDYGIPSELSELTGWIGYFHIRHEAEGKR